MLRGRGDKRNSKRENRNTRIQKTRKEIENGGRGRIRTGGHLVFCQWDTSLVCWPFIWSQTRYHTVLDHPAIFSFGLFFSVLFFFLNLSLDYSYPFLFSFKSKTFPMVYLLKSPLLCYTEELYIVWNILSLYYYYCRKNKSRFVKWNTIKCY